MKKALSIAALVTDVTAAGLFVSSFFVTDNKKAVKRRWIALGLVGVGFGLRIGAEYLPQSKTK